MDLNSTRCFSEPLPYIHSVSSVKNRIIIHTQYYNSGIFSSRAKCAASKGLVRLNAQLTRCSETDVRGHRGKVGCMLKSKVL